jgi:predicted RNA-binding Zn-ribbon protein involved in translation (DUF1610 family)
LIKVKVVALANFYQGADACGGLGRLGVARLNRCPSIDARITMLDRFWHFHCPECGMGDFELGYLAADQEFVCEVCLEDGRGEIRLERWTADDLMPAYARLRLDLAA